MNRFVVIFSFTFLMILSFNNWAKSPDWSPYLKVLQYVKPGVKHGIPLALVNYQQLEKSGLLETVYHQISNFPVTDLEGREEKLAFYINVYNILAIKMVLDHWPVESIKDAGSLFRPVWGKTAGMIGGKKVSLDDIENNFLRPMNEPRIHFAIVCASVSCPDLRTEPFIAAHLDTQLDAQVRGFLHNQKKGVWVDEKEIHVSRIFSWFEKDFVRKGGIETFIKRYRPDLPKIEIDVDVNYDWSLNATNR
jgi:hypothetical protein